jgi:hypothetical protein
MDSIQFTSDQGLGKIAIAAFGLGFVLASHLCLLLWSLLSTSSTTTTWVYHDAIVQWAVYMLFLTFFHFSEFISTAAFKPGFVSYECNYLSHIYIYIYSRGCMSIEHIFLRQVEVAQMIATNVVR